MPAAAGPASARASRNSKINNESFDIKPGRKAAYQASIGSQTSTVASTACRLGARGRHGREGDAIGSTALGGDAVAAVCMTGSSARELGRVQRACALRSR